MDYTVGIMMMDVERKESSRFHQRATEATRAFQEILTDALGVKVQLLTFRGPHLTPAGGAYSPLEFLQIGVTEKLERDVHFLLIVTEVELAATTSAYTLALPSQLTNVGVVSLKRLDPAFWGEKEDEQRVVQRLTTVLLHTFGHLLNLSHSTEKHNVMFDFAGVDDLNDMTALSDAQRKAMRTTLPREAHERVAQTGHIRFFFETLLRNWRSIGRAVIRANPLRLIAQLPTMITAALSVIIIVFFSAEVWDVGSTVELPQLALLSAAAVSTATIVLYRSFAFGAFLSRGRSLSESTVVTGVATGLSVVLTMLLLFLIFMGMTYLGAITIFPQKLMETWPTVDPAVQVLDHVKLSLFVAALGVLAGSLGGRADSKNLVRTVLFIDEET